MGWGLGESKWSPIPSVGGGGSSVTTVSEALTASAGAVSVVGGKLSGGMLDGWAISNPGSVIDSMVDDGSSLSVKLTQTSVGGGGNDSWAEHKNAAFTQSAIHWPNLLMGDFEIEVKFAWAVHANAFSGLSLVTFQFANTVNGWSHHSGVRASNWLATTLKPRKAAAAQGTIGYQDAGTLVAADDNWLKLKRTGQALQAWYRPDTGSYTEISDGETHFGVEGGNVFVGLGFNTRDTSSPGTEDVRIMNVNLTGFEYTATP